MTDITPAFTETPVPVEHGTVVPVETVPVETVPVDDDPKQTWIVYQDGLEPPDDNGFQAPKFSRVTTEDYAKLGK